MKKSEITAADDELDEEDVEIYEATPPQRGNGRNQEEEIEMQVSSAICSCTCGGMLGLTLRLVAPGTANRTTQATKGQATLRLRAP